MGRMGFIAQHAFSEHDAVLDDHQYMTPIPTQGDTPGFLNSLALRTASNNHD